jgi:ABC-2 type transport system ATP-binding protein
MQPINIEGLSKVYLAKGRKKILALDSLDLQVQSGEVFGFLGPNGAGKSTTIKTLMGQLRVTAGTAALFGIPVADPKARKRVGYLPENPSFYDFLTAREYLALVGRSFNMDSSLLRSEIDRVLELLDLAHAAKRPIRGYSKGMVQRLGLAQTLVHDPDLFILDEPMSGLDPMGRSLVKNLMLELKARGKTILFSTHATVDVEAVCDRVAIIVEGKLRTVNVVNELLEKGIDGYSMHLSGCPGHLLAGFESNECVNGVREVFIPCAELNSVLAKVAAANVTILLMEPRRRNLEHFFLDIVKS